MDILPAGISGSLKESLTSRRTRSSNLREQVVDDVNWPTPSSQLAGEGLLMDNLVTKDGEPMQLGERAYNPETGNHVQMTLNRVTSAWPTPRALEIDESIESHSARMEKRSKEGKQIPSQNLTITVKKWPTPVKSDFQDRRASENWGGSDLPSVVDAWPTIVSRDYKGASGRSLKGLENDLPNAIQNWLTPAAREDAACPQSQRMLKHQAKEFEPCDTPTGLQDPMNGNNGSKSLPSDQTLPRLSKRLNPQFVEWLMGHPIGWSSVRKIEMKDYNAWVTESSALLERLLSGSYGKGC